MCIRDSYKHYGKGQTGDTLSLAPGAHTLALQFANGQHKSYGSKMYAKINITVTGGEAEAHEEAPAEEHTHH